MMAKKSKTKTARKPRNFILRIWQSAGLTIAMFGMFVGTWLGLLLSGMHAYNQDQLEHHQPAVNLAQYLQTGDLWEATMENWEGEFLPMAIFVFFTASLYQKGSPESKDPNEDRSESRPTPDSPWPVRRGGWICKLYANSLSLAFLLLFVGSFLMHAKTGACKYSDSERAHGQPAVTMWQYMGNPQFWYQSFQNWQSEFLANGAMVVLAIYLRQKDSPESKKVASPHSAHD